MQTRRIRVGQLSIVAGRGRSAARRRGHRDARPHVGRPRVRGFARGYQRRWVDVLAQQTHGIHGARPHQHDAIDAANREAFEECYGLIKRAWTEDLISRSGKDVACPPGETPCAAEATRRFGAGVENGIVRSIGVVPKPLQRPHPPIFRPFASSERSIRWCAEQGITAVPAAAPPRARARAVRAVRRRLEAPARRRHRRAARRRHRGHGRGGAAALAGLGRVRGRRVVRRSASTWAWRIPRPARSPT